MTAPAARLSNGKYEWVVRWYRRDTQVSSQHQRLFKFSPGGLDRSLDLFANLIEKAKEDKAIWGVERFARRRKKPIHRHFKEESHTRLVPSVPRC